MAAQPHLRQVLRGFLDRVKRIHPEPGVAGLAKRSPVHAPDVVPDGGQFLVASYGNQAGRRVYRAGCARRQPTMNSRHLTGHAVDLVALDGGEVSWQWEDYFRVAAAMQAAPHELEVPVCWGGCWDSLLAIASPEDSVADYVAACRATGQKPFLGGRISKLSRACRHDRLDRDRAEGGSDRGRDLRDQGRLVGPRLPRLVFSPEAPSHARIEALEQFNRDTRLLVPDQAWWSANPLGICGRRWMQRW
jgi:hypothetical protein